MSGHRPFEELTERLSPVRKARAAQNAVALESSLDRALIAERFHSDTSVDGVDKTGDADK